MITVNVDQAVLFTNVRECQPVSSGMTDLVWRTGSTAAGVRGGVGGQTNDEERVITVVEDNNESTATLDVSQCRIGTRQLGEFVWQAALIIQQERQ